MVPTGHLTLNQIKRERQLPLFIALPIHALITEPHSGTHILPHHKLFCFLEIGGTAIVPQPGPPDGKLKPGCPMRPFFGVEPVLVNEKVLHVTFKFSAVTIVMHF